MQRPTDPFRVVVLALTIAEAWPAASVALSGHMRRVVNKTLTANHPLAGSATRHGARWAAFRAVTSPVKAPDNAIIAPINGIHAGILIR